MVKTLKTFTLILCSILLIFIIYETSNYVKLYNQEVELARYKERYNYLVDRISDYQEILINYELIEENDNYEKIVKKYNDIIDSLKKEINSYNKKIKELDKKIQNSDNDNSILWNDQ